MKKLLVKSFDLKISKIMGGIMSPETRRSCVEATTYHNCTDTKYTDSDDNGKVLTSCVDVDCP
ncbi:MAG: hypothetical protein KA210_02680 [Bacteroidia bacterium]|jgi:hypothetical protein|nr:hypothetical protein [Bacteroidia bacterium]